VKTFAAARPQDGRLRLPQLAHWPVAQA